MAMTLYGCVMGLTSYYKPILQPTTEMTTMPRNVVGKDTPPLPRPLPCCHRPLPSHPPHPLPYPHAHRPHARPARPELVEGPKPSPYPCRRKVWVQSLPRRRPGACPARLPCFPLSVSGHIPPRPSASVRLAPWQIRLSSFFSTVSTPPSGALGPSSGPCLADTTCLPLSTCPSRLNPKLRRAAPGTDRPGKNAQHHSKQIRPELTGGGRHGLP